MTVPADHWVYSVGENIHVNAEARAGIGKPNVGLNTAKPRQQQQQVKQQQRQQQPHLQQGMMRTTNQKQQQQKLKQQQPVRLLLFQLGLQLGLKHKLLLNQSLDIQF